MAQATASKPRQRRSPQEPPSHPTQPSLRCDAQCGAGRHRDEVGFGADNEEVEITPPHRIPDLMQPSRLDLLKPVEARRRGESCISSRAYLAPKREHGNNTTWHSSIMFKAYEGQVDAKLTGAFIGMDRHTVLRDWLWQRSKHRWVSRFMVCHVIAYDRCMYVMRVELAYRVESSQTSCVPER